MSTTEAGRTYISRHAPCLQYRRSERFGPHPQLCRPSAQTVQQAAHPASLTDRMDFVVLEQRAHHAVAQHRGWNIQRLQLECSQSGLAAHTGVSQSARRRVHKRAVGSPRPLVIGRRLCEERALQPARLVQVRDQPECSPVTLRTRRVSSPSRCRKRRRAQTEVASEPVLQTVMTLSLSPLPPRLLTCSTSQSPPHLDINLFRPTSSASISFASAMRSSAIARGSFPAPLDASSFFASRRVAAPRLTAVGRAVKMCARIASTCTLSASIDPSHSGAGEACSAPER